MDVSSNESLGEETVETLPLKRSYGRKKTAKTLGRAIGRPVVLSFAQRVEVWHRYTLGEDIFGLSIEFGTTPKEVQSAINLMAAELDYPHNHIDPELERFKIVEAADRMKEAIVKSLTESKRILDELEQARKVLKDGLDVTDLEDVKTGLKDAKAEYFALLTARQGELKTVVALLAEYRATNLLIADLTGIKKTKVERKPKKVLTPEERLEGLSTEELLELAENNNAN